MQTFAVTAVSISGDMTSQVSHFQELWSGTQANHDGPIFTPWKSAKFQGKSNFMCGMSFTSINNTPYTFLLLSSKGKIVLSPNLSTSC